MLPDQTQIAPSSARCADTSHVGEEEEKRTPWCNSNVLPAHRNLGCGQELCRSPQCIHFRTQLARMSYLGRMAMLILVPEASRSKGQQRVGQWREQLFRFHSCRAGGGEDKTSVCMLQEVLSKLVYLFDQSSTKEFGQAILLMQHPNP